MFLFSAYNIIYLILLPLFVQLIESAPNPLDELTINVNIGGTDSVHCGVKKEGTQKQSASRIFGGNETEINEYPWMVHMTVPHFKTWCGGSLIADRWILTAAHCLWNGILEDLDIALGEHDLSTTTETKITKHVKADLFITHSGHDDVTKKSDIALLRIPPIDLKTFTPICLPPRGEDYSGEMAWVYGWGSINPAGDYPDKLQEVEIPVLSDDEFKKEFARGGYSLSDAQLAVMVAVGEKGKDSCYGDSGGPLSYANPDNNGRHQQVGIVSWGIGCDRGFPGVYTEVSALRSWIDDQIAKNGGGTFGTA